MKHLKHYTADAIAKKIVIHKDAHATVVMEYIDLVSSCNATWQAPEAAEHLRSGK